MHSLFYLVNDLDSEMRMGSPVKVGMGQLTGRGNRRLEVIGDVIGREREFISIGGHMRELHRDAQPIILMMMRKNALFCYFFKSPFQGLQ